MAQTKYYRGLEELHNTTAFQESSKNEFPEEMSVDEFLGKSSDLSTNRRDFLKFLGFSVTAATVAACETPVIKSIPYVNKPEEIIPGVANWYATTYYDGNDFANILVKTREGRPIFIKGNTAYGSSKGSTGPRVNASVLGLYDSARLTGPMKGVNKITWDAADAEIGSRLASIKAKGGKIRVLSNTIISPSTKAAIDAFVAAYNSGEGTSQHIVVDAYSYAAIRLANKKTFGTSLIPNYNFGAAKTIVSIAADFLSTWLNTNDYIEGYSKNRKADSDMSRHFQFESLMSITGGAADVRQMVKPSEEGLVALAIYNHIAAKSGKSTAGTVSQELMTKTKVAADELWANRGAGLVIAGANNVNTQVLVNATNQLLGNYGTTIDISRPLNMFNGDDEAAAALVQDMKSGSVDALIIYGSNPCYHFPKADEFTAALKKVDLKVSFADYADETASMCTFILPDSHYLESWNDYSVRAGEYALAQPTISKLFNTRQAQQSFLNWAGNTTDYLNFIKATAQATVFPKVGGMMFADFWNNAVHNGSVSYADAMTAPSFIADDAEVNLAGTVVEGAKSSSNTFEVYLYQSNAMGVGNQANNPWLQELPDAMTKICWDNYATMSPEDAAKLGVNTYIGERDPASVVSLTIDGKEIKLPAFVLPGQKSGTLAIAVGYGRGANGENIGKAAFATGTYGGHIKTNDDKLVPIGQNVFPFAKLSEGAISYIISNVELKVTGEEYELASTQTQHTVMGRDSVVRETTLATFKKADKEVYNPIHALAYHEGDKVVQKPISEVDLWDKHPVEHVGHRWGMAIDLNTCFGCGACIISCHSENNVPVVGKDEVRRSRDMHWLRLDRYFSSTEEETKKHNGEDFSYTKMEVADANPKVVFMPMMCQHCNHAPCETVCPVAATTHSNEGINQMTYNRCIGTRYCANNCPYKVRRFNWFNYQEYRKFTEVNPAQDDLGRMVLNPDVTVRARGVMEKCSLCVGRIQAGKLEAKKAGTPVADGAIQTACSEACPTGAITFGDINDKESKVAGMSKSNRAYRVIEEVGTQTNMYYMVKVRNIKENEA